MKTAEKLKIVKEILATTFVLASEKAIAQGLTYTYKSYPDEIEEGEETFKFWNIDILVNEAGYGQKTIQQFRFGRPNNIDAKNMEYHSIVEVLSSIVQTGITTWYEVGKMLAADKDIQKDIIDETKKGTIITDK